MRNHIVGLLFLCTLFIAGFATPGCAQAPSLAPADAYYITADTEFGKETFTVIRDGRKEEQFYFVPARPHVALETKNGKQYPVFQLLTYQRKMADAKEPVQGGVLQMSIQTGISDKTQKSLLNTIRGQFPLSDSTKTHRLSPIPMKNATISMYDFDGKMVSSAPVKEGVAPMFGNQQYPFMLNLTDLGFDVLKALCEGKGGVPVIITYTFEGMTAPGGFKIEVDWDMCYKHLSTDTKLRGKVGYGNLGANLGADLSSIRDEMVSNGMMKITALTNEALSDSALDAAMNPVLSLITSELFENIKCPPQITPAAAAEIAPPEGIKEPAESGVVASATEVAKANGLPAATPTPPASSGAAAAAAAPATDAAAGAAGDAAAGAAQGAAAAAGDAAASAASTAASTAASAIPYVGTIMKVLDVAADIAKNTKVNIGASFALKDAKLVKKGKFTYTYDRQAIVDRKSSFGGPIGIGSFDAGIRKECQIVLPEGHWESAFYYLPSVGSLKALGLSQMNISVVPVCNGAPVSGMAIESAFVKKTDEFWTDKSGKEVKFFLFALKALYASPEYQSNPDSFKFQTTIEAVPEAGQKVSVVSETPIFNGTLAMNAPSELMQSVIVSADDLSFGPGADEVNTVRGTLVAEVVDANGKSTGKKLEYQIKLDANKTTQAFLVPCKSLIKINRLQFISKKGNKYDWAMSGKNLNEEYPGYDIAFYDNDWQQNLAADAITGAPDPESVR